MRFPTKITPIMLRCFKILFKIYLRTLSGRILGVYRYNDKLLKPLTH
jgi:hypothetical protein